MNLVIFPDGNVNQYNNNGEAPLHHYHFGSRISTLPLIGTQTYNSYWNIIDMKKALYPFLQVDHAIIGNVYSRITDASKA